ncbi:MAG: hypothetical protein ACRD22_09720 [Terriglobia bacterium]
MMIFVTARPSIEGYRILAYKPTVRGDAFNKMIHRARHLRANAVFNIGFDIRNPVGVSEYQLTESLPKQLKGSLPTVEELEAGLKNENRL